MEHFNENDTKTYFNLKSGFIALLLLTFCLLAIEVSASHSTAANLRYKHLGGNTYEVKLDFFRDCSGISAPLNPTINLESNSCGYTGINAVPIQLTPDSGFPVEVDRLCANVATNCVNPASNYMGIQKYSYSGVVNVPSNCADWKFSYSICCRNPAITNIVSPGGQSMFVEALLNNLDSSASNSSPEFITDPFQFLCIGQNITLSQGAIDPDGDSLVFSLVDPAVSSTQFVSYLPAFSANNPLSLAPGTSLQFDPTNGSLNLTPVALEVSVFAVKIEEYRNGVLLGTSIRDMQVQTVQCQGNNLPTVYSPQAPNFTLQTCVNDSLFLQIFGNDLDSNQNLTITHSTLPGWSFISGNGTSNPVLQLSWNPTIQDIGTHTFTVTIQDDACPSKGSQTFTYTIIVNGFDAAAVSAAIVDESCSGQDGSIALGNIPSNVSVFWTPSNFGSGTSLNNIPSGIYIASFIDSLCGSQQVHTYFVGKDSCASNPIDTGCKYFSNVYGDSLGNVFTANGYDPVNDEIFLAGKNLSGGFATLVRISGNGQLLLSKQLIGGPSSYSGIERAPNGDFVLYSNAGENHTITRTNAQGNILFSKTFDNAREREGKLVKSNGDSYFIVSWYTPGSISVDDILIHKIDGNGNVLFTKRFDNEDDQTYDARSNGQGGLLLAGSPHNVPFDTDIYGLEIDANGNLLNSTKIKSFNSQYEEGVVMIKSNSGGAILLSRHADQSGSYNKFSIMKLSAGFQLQWHREFTAPGLHMTNYDLAEDIHGSIYASYRRVSNGQDVSRILKLTPGGKTIWTKGFDDMAFVDIDALGNGDLLLRGSVDLAQGLGDKDGFVARTDTSLNSCLALDYITYTDSALFYQDSIHFSPLSLVITETADSVHSLNIAYNASELCQSCIGCEYAFGDVKLECGDSSICIPLIANQVVSNGIIGLDFCLNYDTTALMPTGFATLGSVVLGNLSSGAQYHLNTQVPGQVFGTIFYDSSVPSGTFFQGAGQVICVEFVPLANASNGVYTIASCGLDESYTLSQVSKCVDNGSIDLNQAKIKAKVVFMDFDGLHNGPERPLKYDASNPQDFLITEALSTNQLTVKHTDLNGEFTWDPNDGSDVELVKDIQGSYGDSGIFCTDVFAYINGADSYLAALIASFDQNNLQEGNNQWVPSAYQMIAADVNMNDMVRANDNTLIMDRSIRNICEYPQVWNYTGGTPSNPLPGIGADVSKDWRFISTDMVYDQTHPSFDDFQADPNYPVLFSSNASQGYWRDDVPDVSNTLNIVSYNNGSQCPDTNKLFHGILLGDITGSWDPATPNPVKASGFAQIDFNAVSTGSNTYRVYVSYQHNDPRTAVDFRMDYDESVITVLNTGMEAAALNANMIMDHNNFEGDKLYLSSYTLQGVQTTQALYYIDIKVNGTLSAADFGDVLAMLNGEIVNTSISIQTASSVEEQFTFGYFNAYPNPATNFVNVEFAFDTDELIDIQLVSASGQLISSKTVNNSGSLNNHQFDLSELSNGVYFIKASSQSINEVKRIIKQ
ncbi:MAG: T9SS type A sorting domain-containing protein [Flavobacteriales bacterium]|nr:T9SS type A sorting domain-containing protein [Flavobacteriales bacterium]